MKRIVTLLMFLGTALPFILLTDLYPFFRFGMFAEPVKREIQTERFLLQYIDKTNHPHHVTPQQVGLSGLNYLLRNYYYRRETPSLLQKINQLYPGKQNIRKWQLLRITSPVNRFEPDTTVAGELRVDEVSNSSSQWQEEGNVETLQRNVSTGNL